MKAYQNGRVSFRNVVFFQLEEFRGIPKDDERSFASRMYEYFFKYVDACSKNVYFLDGTSGGFRRGMQTFRKVHKGIWWSSPCMRGGEFGGWYRRKHSCSCLTSRTRQKTRTSFILNDRFHTHNGVQDVDEEKEDEDEHVMESNYVLTMGLGTIMEAQEVIALFVGSHAARALHHVLEESISNMFPASILQQHDRVCVICERRSISTLRYTTVEYFVGLRENYNIVHNLGSKWDDST